MRYVMNGIEGVEFYGIVSLLIFFTFFLGVSIWAFSADKGFLNRMKNLPLDDMSEVESKNSIQ